MDKKVIILNRSHKFRNIVNGSKNIKYIFYQNIALFNITSLYIENINPNHKFIVYGKKKGEKHGNYKKICMFIKMLILHIFK